MILGTYGRVLRGNETEIRCFILEEKSVCCADFITRREKRNDRCCNVIILLLCVGATLDDLFPPSCLPPFHTDISIQEKQKSCIRFMSNLIKLEQGINVQNVAVRWKC